jgi:TatD DNase family protein
MDVSLANLTDSHCHLNFPPLSGDTDGVLARAAARGVTRVVVPAYDHASWQPIVTLAKRPNVFAALGLHPWLAHETLPGGDLAGYTATLATAIQTHAPVAVGEIGLDTNITTSGLDRQLPLLEAQLALAAELDLPVILHCRGAFEELLTAVGKHGGRLRGVLHAYSRGPELAERFLGAGLHLGFGGAVTRDRAKRLLKTAVRLPLDRILLETDAPSIGLDGVLPAETEPAHVRDIATALATLRDEPVATIAAATTANADRLFDLT